MAKKQSEKSTITELPRIYGESELQTFEKKIQKFKIEKVNVETGGVLKVLNYDELGVAYGSLVKREVGKTRYYMIPQSTHVGENIVDGSKRYTAMWNLIEQWQRWRSFKDSKIEFAQRKDIERLEETASQTITTEVLF